MATIPKEYESAESNEREEEKMENKNKVRGFKVFNPDWTCRGYQFEVGKTFEEDVIPKCCEIGFHFCIKAADCFDYYGFYSGNKVAEVIALGDIDYQSNDSKACTNKIKIMREIPWDEVLRIVNTGKDCTGRNNTGDCNTGSRNTGDYNTGDYNTSNYNTGCFMTEEQKIMLFNKPTDWTYSDWLKSNARSLLNQIPRNVVEWICTQDMTDEEKEAHPSSETTGGYLKVLNESECGQIWWDGLSDQQKDIIMALPNFDPEIFEQCTGIKCGQEK